MNTADNHIGLLKLNLQFFAEEDAILPNDFTPDTGGEEVIDEPSVEEPTTDEPVEEEPTEEVDIEPSVEEETPSEPPSTIKVKFNKEERDIPLDEAQTLVQKGLNYDKQLERLQQLESDPRLSFVESLAKQNGMSTEEFIENFNRAQEESQLNELIQQNIPEELAREIMENKKFREQFEANQKQQEQQAKEQQDYKEFFDYFRNANGRDFNAESDQLPQELWDQVQSGVPLKYAYMEHHNNQLQMQLKTQKTNQSNKKKAPVGSVTAHGGDNPSGSDPFLSGFNSI